MLTSCHSSSGVRPMAWAIASLNWRLLSRLWMTALMAWGETPSWRARPLTEIPRLRSSIRISTGVMKASLSKQGGILDRYIHLIRHFVNPFER